MTYVKIQHVRAAGICGHGLRSFCQEHGIDMVRLARQGIPDTELESIEDVNLDRVIEIAKKGS